MLEYSVVIPFYNEEENVQPLFVVLKRVMDDLGKTYEVIFVNDGSEDKTLDELCSANFSPHRCTVVNLKERYGQSIALEAGLSLAQADTIITLDGDLQNNPQDIPLLLAKMQEGFDAMCGWRNRRSDSPIKLLASGIANRLRRAIMGENIHDVGCSLRVFKKSVLHNVHLSKNMHRFFSLIMLKLGYKITEVKIGHYPRRFGSSKYNIRGRILPGIKPFFCFAFRDIRHIICKKPQYEIKEIIQFVRSRV